MEISENVISFLNAEIDPFLTNDMSKKDKAKMAMEKGDDLIIMVKQALEAKIKELKS